MTAALFGAGAVDADGRTAAGARLYVTTEGEPAITLRHRRGAFVCRVSGLDAGDLERWLRSARGGAPTVATAGQTFADLERALARCASDPDDVGAAQSLDLYRCAHAALTDALELQLQIAITTGAIARDRESRR